MIKKLDLIELEIMNEIKKTNGKSVCSLFFVDVLVYADNNNNQPHRNNSQVFTCLII